MQVSTPAIVAMACALLGSAAAIGGVFILAGIGWALIASSVPLLALSAVLTRGLLNGE
jgi:hypothetical protein